MNVESARRRDRRTSGRRSEKPSESSGSQAITLLRDAVARLVVVQEAIEDGNPSYAHTVAHELELDIAGCLHHFGDDIVRVCLADFNTIPASAEEAAQ